ncbi:Fc.00g070940.m01.CDS01 [Cosmosporella sp. VM-42]
MGASESKAAGITPTISPDIARRGFPPRFLATYKKSWSKLAILLSEPDAAEPSHIIAVAHGSFGDMVLHNGPTGEHPPLANVKPTGKFGQDFIITLPGEGGTSRQELLRWNAAIKKETYWFGMEVGEGANRRVERFEWRHSHGSEVKSLGRSKWGYKLVRLGGENVDPSSQAIEYGPDRGGFTSDGKEIVAVWADAGMSVLKIGEFELRGSGATGEFGTAWSLMAVMSYMCIWQKTYQMTVAASAAA